MTLFCVSLSLTMSLYGSMIFKAERQLYIVKNALANYPRVTQSAQDWWHLIKLEMFLAHLSQRLIGELIVYSCSGVRPSASYVVVHNFKHLLLSNPLPDQSQILCGASLGRRNDILFAASGSHDQDGRQANIWSKPFKNLLLQNRQADFHETSYVASGTPAHHSLFK